MATIGKSKPLVKSINQPDETRQFAQRGHADILALEGVGSVLHGVYEPGWQWSKDVKPIVNTPSCQSLHLGYILRGRIRVKMDDGTEAEMGSGDVVRIPAGHDAWVVGNEVCEMIDFGAYPDYAKPPAFVPTSTGSSAATRPSIPRK